MRSRFLVVACISPVFFAAVGTSSAQEAAKPDRCERVLRYWEQTMASVPTLEADCKQTRTSRRFGTAEVYEGKFRYLQSPTVHASVELQRTDDAKNRSKIVLNDDGVFIYQYDAKQVCASKLPKEQRGPGSNPLSLIVNPLGFEYTFSSFLARGLLVPGEKEPAYAELTLFGATMSEAKKRFEVTLKGEDEYYFYLEVRPRRSKDVVNFQVGRLTLLKTTYLPAQIWYQQPNGDEITWAFTHVEPAAKNLQPADFTTPTPEGWKKIVSPLPNVTAAP